MCSEKESLFENGGVFKLSSVDVAKWFIFNNDDFTYESWDSKIKLQKLLFYSQAMHLAVTEEPLFTEKFEAWKFGPVEREVYIKTQHEGLMHAVRIRGIDVSDKMEREQLLILKTINFIYGQKTSHELVDLTHAEEPWKSLEDRAMNMENPIITLDSIARYYKPLKEVFEAHRDFDFDAHVVERINGNRFIYNIKETNLTDKDMGELWEFALEESGGTFHVYKDEEGELVVY
ncbi:Panacea domain-containing protein [Paenibacillus lautus]